MKKSNEYDTILETLRQNEIKLEKEFRLLEIYLQRIVPLLFEEPTSSPFDWLFRVIEKPELASALGMPSGRITTQIRPLLASDSGFTEAMRAQIAHRLYSIFEILGWLENNPLCPNWIKSYADTINNICNLIKNGFISVEEVDDINKMKKAWRLGREWISWDVFHDVTSLDISYLFPTLRYFNNPKDFGKKMKIYELNDDNRQIFNKFVDQLTQDISHKLDVFIDFAKLLWCIDTFLLNSQIAREYSSFLGDILIPELQRRWTARKEVFKPDKSKAIKMPAPEIYTYECTLLFSAGWALEIRLLCESNPINNHNNEIKSLKFIAETIADEGIRYIINSKSEAAFMLSNGMMHSNLYSICQRFWFLLECWHYRAIRASMEFHTKLRESDNNTTFIHTFGTKNKYFYYKKFWDDRINNELGDKGSGNQFEVATKIKNNKKLPGTLYSIFLLGGAGIGKTTIVKALSSLYLIPEKKVVRYIPIDIENHEELINIFESHKIKPIIFFLDEIHLKNRLSPYVIMLDPLQEGKLKNKEIKCKPIYVFASSAYRSREEFERDARDKKDIAMRDFATRIRFWIELPDLWQAPEQKFVLAYSKSKNDGKKEIASLITINAMIRNAREIECAIDKNIEDLKKEAAYCVRGEIIDFFFNK